MDVDGYKKGLKHDFLRKSIGDIAVLSFFVKVNRYVKKNIKVENLFAYSIKNI